MQENRVDSIEVLVERDGCVHPRDEAEVQALVRHALARGRAVRVVGSRHSIAPAIHATPRPGTEPLELCLDLLDAVEFDDFSLQVRVGTGCRFGLDPRDPVGRSRRARGLCAQLEARGWALASLAGITHQSVGGFLATGSSGASLRHSLASQVLSLRLVDGRGELVELVRGRDEDFDAALVSLGLLGVVTEVRLQCEPSYALRGREQVFDRAHAPFDLEADGRDGLMAFFRAHDYARVLWWPQPYVDRLVVWTAEREPPSAEARSYQAFPTVLGSRIPMQAAAGAVLTQISKRVARDSSFGELSLRALAAVYRTFVPRAAAQEFAGPWHEILPLDDQIDERWMPVEFTELWIAEKHAAEALRRLARLFAGDGYAATQAFACELYPGSASEAWLDPGHRRDSLRINLFWLDCDARDPTVEWFPHLHAALAELAPRLHWGKHLARDPSLTRAVAASYPRRDEFLRLRARFDPDGLFYTDYWRAQLGLECEWTPAPKSVVQASARLFHLEDATIAGPVGDERRVVATRSLNAPRERVAAVLRECEDWPRFVPGLLGVTRLREHCVELEFEGLRVRAELGHTDVDTVHWTITAASVPMLAASLELALAPSSARACTLDAITRLRLPAALDPVLGPLVERRVAARLAAALETLAAQLDSRVPSNPPKLAFPVLFRFGPVEVALLDHATEHLRASATIWAPAELLDRSFVGFEAAERWLPQFLGVRWLDGPEPCFDEYFTFMTLRVRTLIHDPGVRWIAACEACSLPLASRMIEELRFEPLADNRTRVDWHIAFDPPPLLRPGVGLVAPRFGAWMQRCLDGLADFHHNQRSRER
jgi:FAD/FMN-containing dehydrogenase